MVCGHVKRRNLKSCNCNIYNYHTSSFVYGVGAGRGVGRNKVEKYVQKLPGIGFCQVGVDTEVVWIPNEFVFVASSSSSSENNNEMFFFGHQHCQFGGGNGAGTEYVLKAGGSRGGRAERTVYLCPQHLPHADLRPQSPQ